MMCTSVFPLSYMDFSFSTSLTVSAQSKEFRLSGSGIKRAHWVKCILQLLTKSLSNSRQMRGRRRHKLKLTIKYCQARTVTLEFVTFYFAWPLTLIDFAALKLKNLPSPSFALICLRSPVTKDIQVLPVFQAMHCYNKPLLPHFH